MTTKRHGVDTQNAMIVKRDDYVNVLNKILEEGSCPFCEENLLKHHQKPIIYKSKHWIITENSWPYKGTHYHFLFIPRVHVETIEDMSLEVWADLQKQYDKTVTERNVEGATLMIRSGHTNITGASVNHLHAHIIVGSARTKDTKTITALVGFKK